MRILIVDDHEIVRCGFEQLLSEDYPDASFYQVSSLQGARGALKESNEGWDLVVLDISFPGGNGLDLIGEIKRDFPKTPILVLSFHAEEDFAVKAFKLGADGYITKSSAADELLAATKKLLSGGKYVTAAVAERLASSVGVVDPQPAHASLSGRELEVLRLVATGKTIKDIANGLALSEKTIGTYRSRLSEKLGLSTNVELARYALKHGLVD